MKRVFSPRFFALLHIFARHTGTDRNRNMNNELSAVVDYMERERNLDRETIIVAIESAILSAAKKSSETELRDMRVLIDRKTFDINAKALMEVVEKITSPDFQITIAAARKIDPEVELGQLIEADVPPPDFSRIGAQAAKQAIMQRIRQAEKDRVYSEYIDREGDLISGTVRRFERNDVAIDLGRAEALLPSSERVPTEEYSMGDQIRCLLLDVRSQTHGPELILSRSHPDFVRRLFEIEVTEIADGSVEIRGIAREAGYRSKVAVRSKDEKIDPVGACVGMRGMRVKNIVRELNGEKVDIVRYSDDIKTYVTNALAPAKLARLEVDDSTHRVKVIVDDDQLSLAIGKKGQNARLTAKLTGWKIDIQKDEAKMDFSERVELAINNLAAIEGISREESEALVGSGFLSVEGILAADLADIESIEDFTRPKAIAVKRAVEGYYERTHGRMEN